MFVIKTKGFIDNRQYSLGFVIREWLRLSLVFFFLLKKAFKNLFGLLKSGKDHINKWNMQFGKR